MISAYGLTFGGLLLLGGRAASWAAARFTVAGLGLFALFSLLCGLATSSEC